MTERLQRDDGPATDNGSSCWRAWMIDEAERLANAECRGASIERVSRRVPEMTLVDAYGVQRVGVERRCARGARVVGYKVGLTSMAMQRQFQIDEPDSGVLLDCAQIADGDVIRTGTLIAPRVEAEIGFLLSDDLSGEDVDESSARAAVGAAWLGLEVIDSRYAVDGITVLDTVADNAACARFVAGEGVPIEGWDLADDEVTLGSSQGVVASGRGRDVLGDPIRSIVWLVQRLAGLGHGLRAGDLVLAGAVHASVPLSPGHRFWARSTRFPSVALQAD